MVSQIIQPGRADVVIREDVIESMSDPKPNSFFDLKTGILRVYHGPEYGNPYGSLIPAKAEQIGTMISQLNRSASVCKNESSINLGRKNNDNIPSTETEMEKKEIALSNKKISKDSDGNDSLLNISTQRPQISDLHDEVQDDKNIREGLGTLKKNFTSNKDDEENNNDDNNDLTDQFEKLQPSPETTDDKDDDWEKPISSKSQQKKKKRNKKW